MASPSKIEIIATEILIKSQKAVANLKDFNKEVNNSADRVVALAQKIQVLQKQTGKTAKQLADMFKAANAPSGKGRFGTLGMSNEQIDKAKKLVDTTKQYTKATQAAGVASAGAGQKAQDGFQRALTGVNALRIAMGALLSMLLFRGIQAIEQFFSGAIKNATEFEDTLFRLSNVERELSDSGIDISMKGLLKGIKDIKKLLPIFSKEDIASLVGKVSISTKDLKFTEQQVLDLSKAIAILNIRSTENETLNQTASKVITAMLSGTTKGVSNLGIQLDNTTIKLQAMKMGFLRSGQSAEDLTKNEKGLVKLQVILNSANGELETMDDYLSTNAAKLLENAAAVDDLKSSVGEFLVPLIPSVTAVTDGLTDAVNMAKILVAFWVAVMGTVQVEWKALWAGIPRTVDDVRETLQGLYAEMINVFFKEIPTHAPKGLQKVWDLIKPPKETATGVPDISGALEDETGEAEKAAQKLQDVMQSNVDKLADIERDYQRKRQDITTDVAEKLADLSRKTALKREDAERSFSQKVEDINRSANQKIADAQADFRNKEEDREKEFQNKMRELREKFLFSLEDALHARDARQVLRLMRQFKMDKKNLEERRKLQEKDDAIDLQRKLADIERDRQLSLEAAKRDYEEKLEQIKIGEARSRAEIHRWQARALSDARTWYQRQLQDQREFLKRKLADLAAAYAQEVQMQNNAMSQLSAGATTLAGMGIQIATPSSGFQSFGDSPAFVPFSQDGFAEGGTVVANKPTVALFGEAGAESATFTPLNKSGRDTNKAFGAGGGESTGGAIDLRIAISEGLIADIIDSSLTQVSAHVEHVRRAE